MKQLLSRSLLAAAALAASTLAGTAAQAVPVYKGAAVIGPKGPPEPSLTDSQLPKPTTANWSCQGSKCTYVKQGGSWSDCFVAYSPTHGGWLPTRFCR